MANRCVGRLHFETFLPTDTRCIDDAAVVSFLLQADLAQFTLSEILSNYLIGLKRGVAFIEDRLFTARVTIQSIAVSCYRKLVGSDG